MNPADAHPQSALNVAGAEAERVLDLTVLMTTAGAAIFVFVLAACAIAILGPEALRRRMRSQSLVVGAGIAFPVVALSALLIYGFFIMRAGEAVGAEAAPAITIHVAGAQWWWRVIYETPDGARIESANEVRVPVGQPVRFVLSSEDVIHSFWIPAYAGKLDMIPGRENVLDVRATKAGIVRGQCAEYCGGAHALMAFAVVALPPEAFEDWLEREAAPARVLDHPGREIFLRAGCGACHTVRGTPADGAAAPDLTHVGGRLTLGAGILDVTADTIALWIGEHHEIKPDNLMPPFEYLSEDERALVGAWLAELE